MTGHESPNVTIWPWQGGALVAPDVGIFVLFHGGRSAPLSVGDRSLLSAARILFAVTVWKALQTAKTQSHKWRRVGEGA